MSHRCELTHADCMKKRVPEIRALAKECGVALSSGSKTKRKHDLCEALENPTRGSAKRLFVQIDHLMAKMAETRTAFEVYRGRKTSELKSLMAFLNKPPPVRNLAQVESGLKELDSRTRKAITSIGGSKTFVPVPIRTRKEEKHEISCSYGKCPRQLQKWFAEDSEEWHDREILCPVAVEGKSANFRVGERVADGYEVAQESNGFVGIGRRKEKEEKTWKSKVRGAIRSALSRARGLWERLLYYCYYTAIALGQLPGIRSINFKRLTLIGAIAAIVIIYAYPGAIATVPTAVWEWAAKSMQSIYALLEAYMKHPSPEKAAEITALVSVPQVTALIPAVPKISAPFWSRPEFIARGPPMGQALVSVPSKVDIPFWLKPEFIAQRASLAHPALGVAPVVDQLPELTTLTKNIHNLKSASDTGWINLGIAAGHGIVTTAVGAAYAFMNPETVRIVSWLLSSTPGALKTLATVVPLTMQHLQ